MNRACAFGLLLILAACGNQLASTGSYNKYTLGKVVLDFDATASEAHGNSDTGLTGAADVQAAGDLGSYRAPEDQWVSDAGEEIGQPPADTGQQGEDLPPVDSGPEDTIAIDVGTPVNCGPFHDIAHLLACGEHVVDYTLDNVLVTYVFDKGYFIADTSTTHGLEMYVAPAGQWTYAKPNPGDVVSVHVSELSNFKLQQEATLADAPVVTGQGDPAAFALNLNTVAAGELTEVNESRLLTGTQLAVSTFVGQDGVVQLPVGGDLPLRVEGVTNLCSGATLTLSAGVLTEYAGLWRVQLLNGAKDIAALGTSGCAGAVAADMANWGFEQPSTADPPPGFTKASTGFTAVRTTSAAHNGKGSCQLTWTSNANQDLVAQYDAPVLAGGKVSFSVWFLDNDKAGRGRVAVSFFKADKSPSTAATAYSGAYSADSAAWQQLSVTTAVPADAAYARAMVRLYDVAASWTGQAAVLVDDWALAVQ